MGSGKKITIGFRYYFDILMGFGRRLDGITHIKVGGKTAWTGSMTSTADLVFIDQEELFGGDKKEGGISGVFTPMFGGPTQVPETDPDANFNGMLNRLLGGPVPGFRGVCTAVFSGLVTSMNPYPKPWEIRGYRITADWDGGVWYPEKALISLTDPETGGQIRAMNPAHILYEMETNRDWGRGKPRARLDDAAFRAAADTLYAEGFGLCLRWARTDSIANFAGSVIAHIGANLYTSRTTALRKLTLIRDDYNVATLPHFTPDTGLISIEEDENSSAADGINEVIVTWKNPVDNSERRARERNPAAIRAAGGRIISHDSNYIGIPTYQLAARVAKRDLRTLGYAKRWKLVLDRRARDIEPGKPFKFSDPARGLSNVVVRAGRIVDGESGGRGTITITAVLDVFGLPTTTFTAPVSSTWVPPNTTPQAITTRRVLEATYRDLVREIDAANLALIDNTTGFLRALAVRPQPLALNYDIQTRVGAAAFATRATGDFCPTALLATAITVGAAPVAVTLSSATDLDLVVVGTAAIIDDEIMRVVAINATALTATLARGCVDTVPATHAIGARVWFVDEFGGGDPTEYTSSTTVNCRLLTNTSSAQLNPALASTDSLTVAARQAKPYAPGNLKINTVAYPASVTGQVVVTWSHRDRGLQADQLVDTSMGSTGPEVGVTYRVRFYSGVTLRRTYSAITGTTCTYLTADETADGGPFNPLRIVVDCVRGGIFSHQVHDLTVARV